MSPIQDHPLRYALTNELLAVSLGAYLLAPFAYEAGIDKNRLTAARMVPVVVLVWLMGRRIRKKLIHK